MKILYGVQGTGNGHLTRARSMSRHLREAGLHVDYVFSGRAADKYYAMEPFGDWRCLEGLTFSVIKGKVKPVGTLMNAKPAQLLKDMASLPVRDYDLVLSDFEPVSAWAARRNKVPCLGLGHQYAFDYPIPKHGDNPLTRTIMKLFAPTDYSIGMHWYHYQQPIVPPIVDTLEENLETDDQKIIVYLPFEAPETVAKLLKEFPDYHFLYYGNFPQRSTSANITYNPVSREEFQKDLVRCGGVISNAGFELASESISLGKKILAKPLHGQMEQISNALALQNLDLGCATEHLGAAVVRDWLDNFRAKRISYPNVAKHIAEWITRGDLTEKEDLIRTLWEQTESHGLPGFHSYRGSPMATVQRRGSMTVR
ncbi:glycosyltransferase [Proteobacteria bacterium 005FR1]|nr:glycosyltransferase [Proteobacteria bacterium 005FR1]